MEASAVLECPECETDRYLKPHCSREILDCGWVNCHRCRTTIDIRSGRHITPKKGNQ